MTAAGRADTGLGAHASAARAFFDDALWRFQSAARAVGTTERFFRIGGRCVRLRFAGPVLLPLITPALAHLASRAEAEPGLSVYLWDGASSGTALPVPSWASEELPPGHVEFLRRGSVYAARQPGDGLLSLLDRDRAIALFCTRDATRVSAYLSVAPLRQILHWSMAERGLHLIHAAAVGTSEGGVLLAGSGGAGKSTCALACLGDIGLDYLAEDYCLLALEPRPRAFSLYGAAKVDRDSALRLPHLAAAIRAAESFDGDKVALFLNDLLPGRIVGDFPVRAVLLPTVTGDAFPSLAPASPTEALAALAPSTIFQQPGAGEAVFRTLARLVRQVPCLRLRVGPDLASLPSLVASVIARFGDEVW